nr:glyceraldehyde 3-phosphate dehydrogenase NAD-binding domain-containing protein [Spirochaetota bacterium]
MSFRIAINGYGRIGRCVLRALYEKQYREKIAIVAVNDIADPQTMTYLTKYDTTHGRFPGSVSEGEGAIIVNGDTVRMFCEEEISNLPWKGMEIDAVLECSGVFSSRDQAGRHIDAGAKKVVFSHPADPEIDAIVYGVNHGILTPDHTIISNASCTSNCVVPILKTIDDAFGIDHGAVTTIHSAMNDQPV